MESLGDRWEPSQYTDQYRENLMKIIRAKLKGKQPKLAEHEEPQSAEVVDLMERLRRSLQSASAPRKAHKTAGRKSSHRKRTRAA